MSRIALVLASLMVLALAGSTAVRGGGLAVLGVQLSDNGDDDGFADTRETVQLVLTVRNTSGGDLTDLSVDLTSLTPTLVCTSQPTAAVGDLPAGETRLAGPFVFTVANVDRAALGLGPLDPLTAVFAVSSRSAPEAQPVHPPKIAFDLDLDVGGGGGPTTFFESFESATLGAFEVQNIDGEHSVTEGFYCQNSNQSHLTCDPIPCPCALGGPPEQAEATFWGVSGPVISPDGGRGFSGSHSLYFGVELGPPRGWTTPMNVLESVASSDPIHIGWDGVTPTLSFVHQVSLADSRILDELDAPVDRAVVMAQVADDQGAPVGHWIRLEPWGNGYDQMADGQEWVGVCMFDPVDDGSTEDDLFPGSWLYGPSSTCSPQHVFANIGETSGPFDAGNVGLADGPGIQGDWGIGTWIESEFDLGRFRGRSIRIRFLATAISTKDWNGNPYETWEDALLAWGVPSNPVPGDDGWWIDDVGVTGLLSAPATVTVDTTDNSGLPGPPGGDLDADGQHDVCDNCRSTPNPDQLDDDGDTAGNLCDCAPLDAELLAAPEEIAGVRVLADKISLQWDSDALNSGPATQYDLLRGDTSEFPAGSGPSEICLFQSVPDLTATDLRRPRTSAAFYYLVRGVNACGAGSYGVDSAANERTSDVCP